MLFSGLKIYDETMFWSNNKNLESAVSNLNFYKGAEEGATNNFFDNPSNALRHFDLPAWARYLAVTFIYRCFHGNGDSNLRYYFHPFKKKLEPISFDNGCGQRNPQRHMGFLPVPQEFVYKLIEIPHFRQMLIDELQWWKSSLKAKDFIREAQEKELYLRKSLSWDAPFLGKFTISLDHIDDIESWLEYFNEKDTVKSITIDSANTTQKLNTNSKRMIGSQGVKKLKISLVKEHPDLKLIVTNPDMQPLKNFRMTIEKNQGIQVLDLKDSAFKKNGYNFVYDVSNLLDAGNDLGEIRKVFLQYQDNETGNLKNVSNIYLTYPDQPMDPMFPSSFSSINSYFRIDHQTRSIILDKHQHIEIKESLILPEDYSLTINEGSILSFQHNGSLVINGGIIINGTVENPVLFSGVDEQPWPGILVLANHNDVIIKGLIMQGATGNKIAGFQYTGALTIVEADVYISDSTFSQNLSEDALNLVSVNGLVERLKISDTTSDGLDVDFGELDIRDSIFSNIGSQTGSDAIDISHSSVFMSNIKIFNTTDKGLSIGESADVKAEGIEVTNALVGVAVKDSSTLKAKNIKLSDISLADVMSYNKKAHHKGASVSVENLESEQYLFLNQNGSLMRINSIDVESGKIDVDSLYGSLMKSIK